MLIAFRHYPLGFHDKAEPAARASFAAHKQGKFWPYHDLLMANFSSLTGDNFIKWAKELKLDLVRFKKDMESPEARAQVKADMILASSAGIEGTPAFLINGRLVIGAVPFNTLKSVIDSQIERVDALVKEGKKIYDARGLVSAKTMRKAKSAIIRATIDGAPVKGAPDPLVTIVVYSDFQ